MEDALVLKRVQLKRITLPCLNPCFNGRCTRTTTEKNGTLATMLVLILVLMEDALVLMWPLHLVLFHLVLILVLMEDALVRC